MPLLTAVTLYRTAALRSSPTGSLSLRRLTRGLSSVAAELVPDEKSELKMELSELKSLAAETERGQKRDTDAKKKTIQELVKSLELTGRRQGSISGLWELIYAEDDVTRASPFFWAFRKAFRNTKSRVKLSSSDMFADNVFYITDTIPFKSVGSCNQRIDLDSRSFVSQVRVNVNLAGRSLSSSLMTTSSTIRPTEDRDLFEIQVDKTEVRLPFVVMNYCI